METLLYIDSRELSSEQKSVTTGTSSRLEIRSGVRERQRRIYLSVARVSLRYFKMTSLYLPRVGRRGVRGGTSNEHADGGLPETVPAYLPITIAAVSRIIN